MAPTEPEAEASVKSPIVFNNIVAFQKLPFTFNNIVALMCSLLFLNDLFFRLTHYHRLEASARLVLGDKIRAIVSCIRARLQACRKAVPPMIAEAFRP